MAFVAEIKNARVLSSTPRGKTMNVFIAWSEKTREGFEDQTAFITVIKPSDGPKLEVRDMIDIEKVKLAVNESEDWKRVRKGEKATADSPNVVFYNLTTFGNQITVTKKGDPTTEKKKELPESDHSTDDLPF